MPRKGRQVIIARGIARSTISGSRKTTTRESPPPPPSLALSFSYFFHFHLRIENTHLEGTRIGIFEPISNFSKEGKIEGRDRSCCTRTHTHIDARNGVVGTCPVPRRTVAGLDLVVGVRACTPCAIRGDGGGERMERVDERGVRPEHVTPDSYTDCCYGINL